MTCHLYLYISHLTTTLIVPVSVLQSLEPLRKLAKIGTDTATFFSGTGNREVTLVPAWLLDTILDLDGGWV